MGHRAARGLRLVWSADVQVARGDEDLLGRALERLLERGVLYQEDRPIMKNRQPGRCCDTGCTTPGQPVMVPLPATRKAVGGAN